MKWQKGLIYLLIIVAFSTSIYAIGYQVNGNYIQVYNDLENYCIDTTTGLQFGVIQGNVCGGGFYNNNEICVELSGQRRCWSSIPLGFYSITSDNLTYVNVSFSKSLFSNNFQIVYSLYKEDLTLYQSFYAQNLVNTRKYNISYVIKDVSFNSPNIFINNSLQPLSINQFYSNPNEDGFSVIDGLDGKYFHFGYNPLINKFISIRNSVINTTYLNEQITRNQIKSYLFRYYDPTGFCISLDAVPNGKLGCVGNQFSVGGEAQDQIVGGATDKLAFRFNATENLYPLTISYRTGTKGGAWASSMLTVGIQYNSATGEPNGTWVANLSVNPIASSINTNNFAYIRNNLTKNQIYHIVFDPSLVNLGDTVFIKYIVPQNKYYSFNFVNHTDMLVQEYLSASSKWSALTSGTSLFNLKGNRTDNVGQEYANYIASQPYGYNGTVIFAGTQWAGMLMTFPYNMTVTGVGASIHLSAAGTPLDNLTYTLRDIKTGENLSQGILINYTQANVTQRWFNVTIKSQVNVSANRTYVLYIHCWRCSLISGARYRVELASEYSGMVQPANNTWYGGIGNTAVTSTNNGTTFGLYSAANDTDRLMYLSGFKFSGVPSPPPVVTSVTGQYEYRLYEDYLGEFDRGQLVNFMFQYINRNYSVEEGANNTYAEVFNPSNQLMAKRNVTQVYSKSGLFYGNYSIPNNATTGIYTIRYNGTVGAINNTANTLFFKVKNPTLNHIFTFMFFFILILLTASYYLMDDYLKMMAGFSTVIVGIFMTLYGLEFITNVFLQSSISIIIMMFGSYLIASSGYNIATKDF